MNWERRVAGWVIGQRGLIFVLTALLSGLAAWGTTRLQFDSDIEIWFLEDDPSLVRYHAFLDEFEADEINVIGIFADDVFAPEVLRAIERITEDAIDAPHAYDVQSLTNVKVIEAQGPGMARVSRLVEELPTTAEAAAALRERALSNTLVRDSVVSADGRAAAVIVELDATHNDFDEKMALVAALRDIATRHVPAGVEWYLTGSPAFDEAFMVYTERDFLVLGPAAFGVALLVCFLLLRRPLLALLPIAVVALADLWIFGLMGWLGVKINVVSSSLIAVVLAVGIADTVHVVADYRQQLAAGLDREQGVLQALSELMLPCFFTSITTVAGFLALMTSSLMPVGQFGWLAAIGVGFAFVLSMSFAPALLRTLPAPRAATAHWAGVDRLLDWLGRPSRRRSWIVLGSSAALLVVAAVALTGLQVGANPMNYFREGDPIRVATARVDDQLGGSASLEMFVQTDAGGMKEPALLERLQKLEHHLQSLPAVTRVFSVLDSLRETRRVVMGGAASEWVLPDTRPMAAQLYLMIEGDEDFARVMKGDYQVSRMTARVRMGDAGDLSARTEEVTAWIAREFQGTGARVEPTGFLKLMSDMERYLLDSQIRSLGAAFLAITLMMWALLRSPRWMALSMIPNLLPILMGLAFMVPAGIALDPGTVMIGSMAMGLVVDDTVHFLVRLQRNLARLEMPDAVDASMHQTGRAILFTSLILAAGLGVLSLASFTPNIAFGMVSAAIILFALAADLLLLPAVLLILKPRL